MHLDPRGQQGPPAGQTTPPTTAPLSFTLITFNFRPLIETAQDGWSLNQVGRVAHPAVADGTGSLSVAPLGGPTFGNSNHTAPDH